MENRIASTALLVVAAAFLSVHASADDADDALAFIERWAALEGDLEGQSKLIGDDRIMIFEMTRWENQAENLKVQLAQQESRRSVDPDGYPIATISSPTVRVYGDTAIVSFIRIFSVIPGNAAPPAPGLSMMTAVLAKERGSWQMVHLHGSTN